MERIRNQWSAAARVTAALSVAVAVILIIVAFATAEGHERFVTVSGVAALLMLGAGIAAVHGGVIWAAVALLAAMGAAADAPGAPLFAVGLFAVAEAGLSSIEERFGRVQEAGVHRDRLVLLGVVMTTALAVGAAMRLFARGEGDTGAQYTVIAALCILALVVLAAERARSRLRASVD